MNAHWRYLKYVLRHKWFVYQAGRKTGVSRWQLLCHDLSKFRPDEWQPYAFYFYGEPFPDAKWYGDFRNWEPWEHTESGSKHAFNVAWLKHLHRNPHHWQHWLGCAIITGNGNPANDDSEWCQCLTMDGSSAKSARYAQVAIENSTERVSGTVDRSGVTAKSAFQTKHVSTEKNTQRNTSDTTESVTLETRKNTVRGKRTFWRAIEERFSNITGEHHQSVPAVENQSTSSLPLTTSTVVEKSTAENTRMDSVDSKPTGGQSKTGFHQSSESSATTATPLSATTVIVPIRETNILVNDDGTVICLTCGKQFPRKLLVALEIPDKYCTEMLADWVGAGRAIHGKNEVREWYAKNANKMILHPDTRARVEMMIKEA